MDSRQAIYVDQAEYVAQAVANRSKMYEAIYAAVEEAFTTLTAQFKEDFKHQRFVRGISKDGSIKEVEAHIQQQIGDLPERILRKALYELDQEGLLYDGL